MISYLEKTVAMLEEVRRLEKSEKESDRTKIVQIVGNYIFESEKTPLHIDDEVLDVLVKYGLDKVTKWFYINEHFTDYKWWISKIPNKVLLLCEVLVGSSLSLINPNSITDEEIKSWNSFYGVIYLIPNLLYANKYRGRADKSYLNLIIRIKKILGFSMLYSHDYHKFVSCKSDLYELLEAVGEALVSETLINLIKDNTLSERYYKEDLINLRFPNRKLCSLFTTLLENEHLTNNLTLSIKDICELQKELL